MGTRYTICRWAINRSDPQNLLSVTLDVPLQVPQRYFLDAQLWTQAHHLSSRVVAVTTTTKTS